ncbi:MAG: argininosuccinate lyase [Ardenticatenaceae bacterium]|nr:argininosuccinate lyase [Ardenticatenaceae bacterium]HBY96488.1 argininosuccinate lyase [Chloroflexota bacterium]
MSAAAATGHLGEGPAAELMASAYRWEVDLAPSLWPGLGLTDLAHSLMLIEVGVIPPGVGRRLVALLLELHALPANQFPLDPALGDAFTNREHWLAERDRGAAGWFSAGRARREATTVAYHLAVRSRVLMLAGELAAYLRVLLSQAEAHVATVMPDYTYLQQAQPTTLAHYLLGFGSAGLRDLERLQTAFRRANLSPAGGGSTNGSRLPLDRQRLAELLGFDGIVLHPRDAMWQADAPVEVMATVVALLLNLDRLAEDLQIWCTQEFGLVELADAHARTSRIMPQKKNPYSLAFVRGLTGELIGQLAAMACVGKTPSGQIDNRIFAYREIPRALDLAIATVRLMAGVLGGLTVDRALMARRAAEGYTQATDLAEVVMQAAGLDYKTAHTIVGRAVRLALAGSGGNLRMPLTAGLIDTAALEVLGRPLGLTEETISAALDPVAIVGAREGPGGAAAQPVRAMLRQIRQAMEAAEEWQRETSRRLADAEARLLELARSFEKDGGDG